MYNVQQTGQSPPRTDDNRGSNHQGPDLSIRPIVMLASLEATASLASRFANPPARGHGEHDSSAMRRTATGRGTAVLPTMTDFVSAQSFAELGLTSGR
jgi:hypothetical protein